MVRSLAGFAMMATILWSSAAVRGDEFGHAIDLTSFGTLPDEPAAASAADDLPLQDVAWRSGMAARRFYASAMIGPSFAGVTSPVDATLASNQTVFAAGGALGVAFERQHGRLRVEVEGMGRNTYDAPFYAPPQPGAATILTNNWSVLLNGWRDLMITDTFGVYAGGGIGGGGYILGERFNTDTVYSTPAGAFAWQGGGGVLWEISNRLTFDVGYRFFQIDTIQQDVLTRPNQFAASELMFTLRLYEPFRNLRH